ncbi:thiamine-monophosphate kinase [Microbacterium terrae]|uniref:Thiamine-monophosphate kinase n=1 Tax=Microbacterium terrae TaxID=69369 RepID=A0A0M2H3K6_9MICO|nr:thiamine-phosphate kinase [Microbacterium terrae]KJL38940.1 Thiamine-monophosphate kinase [Microbacterium terrae]MBP1077120.1 thiamine-monophosphate kinase [Microbacterium terrae]GLJ99714.1 thiamine-monophosphate kinase [Microbacterium terrae]
MSAPDPTVGELSEGRILAGILARVGPSHAAVGPGDDAAVLAAPGGRVVATVDTLVHGPDFRLAWSSAFDLGWKAAAVNLADVAAMGARPTALLVALAMPDDTRMSFVEGIADGLRAACDALAPGCAVEGGDLTVSDTLTLAVTALGALDADVSPVLRSGARPGDVVAVAGALGAAGRGLGLLFSRFTDADGSPVAVDHSALSAAERVDLAAQLRPEPPVALGADAGRHGATAMMDVSDGLVLDATRLADASGVSVALTSASLGADPASALTGGEDHALLATFGAAESLPAGFRVIGEVRARGEASVLVDDRPFTGRGGWDPYRDWDAGTG